MAIVESYKAIFQKSFLLISVILLFSMKASAYIDPGTGGMIVGSIWPYILLVLSLIGGFFIKYFFKPIKRTFLRLWKIIKKEN